MAESRTAAPRSTRRRFTVDALFTDTSPRGVGVSDLPEARMIRLDRIEPDTSQPRRSFDQERLEELAASIGVEGVLQPIAVRYDDGRDVYVIIHGERRWRAATMAGLGAVPSIVRDLPEERLLVQQLMENIVREDLNALDRAAALRALKEQMGNAAWERVAEVVGIRRSRLFQLLDTEKLEPTLQETIRKGLISEKQTRTLHRLPPELQAEIGERLLTGRLSSRDIADALKVADEAMSLESGREALDRLREAGPADSLNRQSHVDETVNRRARALASALKALDVDGLDRRRAAALANELHVIVELAEATMERLTARD